MANSVGKQVNLAAIEAKIVRMADGWKFCVAPMLDWSDRHCRAFHRRLSARARLYSEMVTTGALLHGDVDRHLLHPEDGTPVALQLGGSEPYELARCARLALQYGYDEVNLNCGCPSDRVQRGAFGACLMAEPQLVRDCARAMRDAVDLPVTIKHRIGIDRRDDYGFVRDFVGTVAEAGVQVFIVHARSAWLDGLSPKENREVPPLRYDYARQLKNDFPTLQIVLNGGLGTLEQCEEALRDVDGVMMGRAAYQSPWLLAGVDERLFGATPAAPTPAELVGWLTGYAERELGRGTPLSAISRHLLGLFNGLPGARAWRRLLSDHRELARGDARLFERAAQLVTLPSP